LEPVDAPMPLSAWELALRIVTSGALGGLVGLEREFADQVAGFRTHILVSLGAALFTLVGAYEIEPFIGHPGVGFDPTRVAAQVVTGIGFLGAGAILRQGVNVRGLTTAASLWVTAAIGVAVGLGAWWAAAIATVTTVGALYGLKQIERGVFRRIRRGYHRFVIEMGPGLRLSDLASVIEEANGRVMTLRLASEDGDARQLVAAVWLPPTISPDKVAYGLSELDGVAAVSLD
jgi:putative Mg2+ transporter-C (MgtC) family protein